MSAMQQTATRGVQSSDAKAVWLKAFMFSAVLVGLMLLAGYASAADQSDEFFEASERFAGWVTGSLGRLAAFVALGVGSVVAAVRKDWSWFFGAVVLSIGVGVLVTIIDASFTATI